MYRVMDHAEGGGAVFPKDNKNAESNCREWQQYTSADIPLTDIYQVVYKMSLDDFEAVYDSITTTWCPGYGYDGSNAFLQWLSQTYTTDATDYLLLAKTTEDIRSRQNSRWYYPSMRTKARMTLEEVAEKALAYRGPLRDRYLLQAVRALFSLRRYAECIELWDGEACMLPEGSAMRQLILPYVAGAEYRTGNCDKAVAYFYEAGDFPEMIACSGADKPEQAVKAIERIYQFEPNCSQFPKILHSLVHRAEPDGIFWKEGEENLVRKEHRQLARLAVRIAREGKTRNPAMWYYTAAFIEDLDGHADKASQLLTRAEHSQGTELIRESVKVMRIYLDAKLMPYGAAYESRLFGQLQWLDRKIAENITPEVRERTADSDELYYNVSYYYWNDMMRRIVLAEVCPRMIAAGRHVRAMQLANMADNRLLGLVDQCIYRIGKPNSEGEPVMCRVERTMHEARRDKDRWKRDYSNSFFEMIDSLGADRAMAYRNRIERPRDAFDRFLNERGYVDMEYINDIVGTQYLRTMRYGDAVACLRQVSRSFEGHLNTTIHWDPFSYRQREMREKSDFKYRFAREMSMLEQEMNLTTDPDRKAQAMVRLATGMVNSFGRCWALTQYYRGTSYHRQVVQKKRDWENGQDAVRARECARELFQTACALFTDQELAAATLYELSQYRTVAEKYPETETGEYVRGHCDKLHDYVY